MQLKKYFQNKKKAFTLVELILTLVITGVIVSISMPIFVEKNFDNRFYASTYKLFQEVNAELVAKSAMSLYCSEFSNTVNYAQNVPVNCADAYGSNPSSTPDKPNFVLANGIRIYGMEVAIPVSPAYKTVNINIKRNAAKHTDGTDLLNIKVFADGIICPTTAAELAILNKYDVEVSETCSL
jgi:prepilin-type N-terminal cleavage/methylation domain-containing protein